MTVRVPANENNRGKYFVLPTAYRFKIATQDIGDFSSKCVRSEENSGAPWGSNQQPFDSKSNAFPIALPRKICEVEFKQLLYSAIV